MGTILVSITEGYKAKIYLCGETNYFTYLKSEELEKWILNSFDIYRGDNLLEMKEFHQESCKLICSRIDSKNFSNLVVLEDSDISVLIPKN